MYFGPDRGLGLRSTSTTNTDMAPNRLSQLLLVFLIFLLSAFPAYAKEAPLSPLDTVQKLLSKIQQIESGDKTSPRQEEINRNLSDEAIAYLDVKRVSQNTLGKHWKTRTDQEQKEFVNLLGDLFKFVAFPNSAKFFSELELNYGKSKIEKDRAIVPLNVVHKEEGQVNIDFILNKNDDFWQVQDVILDGVSMRNNLRSQFMKVIKKNDYPDLVKRMLKKLKEAKG